MKKLLLTLLFTASCCANTNNPIQTELDAKQAQLSLLSEQIIQKEEELGFILKKIQNAIDVLKINRKEILQNISNDEIEDMYVNDIRRFFEKFNDINNKKSQLIFDSDILKDAKPVTKFYIIIYMQENSKLEELIKKWAALCDEVSDLKVN